MTPCRPGPDVLERASDERQRRAKLMADVGKETRLHRVQLHQFPRLRLDFGALPFDLDRALGDPLRQFAIATFQAKRPAIDHTIDHAQHEQHVAQIGRVRFPPRRRNGEAHRRARPIPAAVVVRSAHPEDVIAGRDVGVISPAPQHGTAVKLRAARAIDHVEGVHLLGLWVEAHEPTVGTEPETVLLIFQD